MDVSTIIKNELESAYDIPFYVEEKRSEGEPSFLVSPYNEDKRLFEIYTTIHNGLRLTMEFQPQKYGAYFIREMERQAEESRIRFWQYVKLLDEYGAKVNFTIDGKKIILGTPVESWPTNWHNVDFRVTVMPVAESPISKFEEYSYVTRKWIPIMVGAVLCLSTIEPIEPSYGYLEGNKVTYQTIRYERNRLNRKLCIERNGCICKICRFDFEKTYGEIGKNFIHVHHIIPISQIGPGYRIDPEKDLIPICPNCHAMLHRFSPPITPEDLQHKLKNNKRCD